MRTCYQTQSEVDGQAGRLTDRQTGEADRMIDRGGKTRMDMVLFYHPLDGKIG